MRNIMLVSFILILTTTSYISFHHIINSLETEPTKKSLLAMTADLTRKPASPSPHKISTNSPPNIIIILADDLGWRDVGYNQSEIRTPEIDRMASEGVTLNRFYVQPTCSPTRAALLTGRAPMRLGIVGPLSKNNPAGLPLSETTLADHLKSAGYQTALTGKWHLGARNLNYHPNARGFDHFYGNLTGAVGYYNKIHGGGYDWQRNGKTVREEGYTTDLIAQEAVQLIKERDPNRPIFLYAAFGSPHLPNEAPKATIDTYAEIGNKHRRVHAAMVSEMDKAIGKIHAALVTEGIENETLIWFMSDNGGLFPENPARHLPNALLTMAVESRLDVEASPKFIDFVRTNLREGGSDNRPLKGGKQSISEGGVRVPAFLFWPNNLEPASYNYMVTVQDVLPTLLDIVGMPKKGDTLDGRSVWTAIKTNSPAIPKEYIVQTSWVDNTEAVYLYPYKLMNNGNGKFKLYNVETDPLEKRNIISKEHDMASKLSAFLKDFPRGKKIGLPIQDIAKDTDYFGGEEDRDPWADRAYRNE